jgi:phosphatidylglycerol---prolipoprotein diacylglyceryl transferase
VAAGRARNGARSLSSTTLVCHREIVHPILFRLFGTPIHAYTVTMTLGIGGGVVLGFWLGRREGRSWRDLFDMGLVAVLGGLLGAKVFHAVFEAKGHHLSDGRTAHGVVDLLLDDPWHWARLFEAGFVFYGGIIGAALLMWVYAIRREIPDKGGIGDYAVPGILMGIFVGRIGCFLAGCCYGAETDWAWAVHFPADHASHGASVHPVQLLDASFGLVGLALSFALWGKRRFSGEALCAVSVA